MKQLKLLAIICLALLASSSACSPDPDPIDDYESNIWGTWYSSTSNIAGSSWYELTFEANGTGTFINERPYNTRTASFQWKMKGNQVICNGYMVNINSDAEIEESGSWTEAFTYSSVDKKLKWDRLSNFWFKKLGEDYPDDDDYNNNDDEEETDEDGDEEENDNNDENDEPEPKPEFVPYLRVEEKLPQRSSGNKYYVTINILYGGGNIPSSGIKSLGFEVTVESGYFDFGDRKTWNILKDVEVIDDKTYYWTSAVEVFGSKSSPIRISVKEKWIYESHSTTYLGEPIIFEFPYDASKDDGVYDDTPLPIQPGTSGMLNGHEWVDLGLSVKWATMNVGANAIHEVGELFQIYLDEDHYKVDGVKCNETYTADEAVRAIWGDGWRLPTESEMQELIDLCDVEWDYLFNKPIGNVGKYWTTINGVEGAKIWGDTGQSIFLPSFGKYKSCAYWTSSSKYYNGYNLSLIGSFPSDVIGWRIEGDESSTYCGVRAVCR